MTNTTNPAGELLPCPFCKSENIDPKGGTWPVKYEGTYGWGSGPKCGNCGATAKTVEKWNTRPTVSDWDREEMAEKMWRADLRRSLGRDQAIEWSEIEEVDRERYRYLTDTILARRPVAPDQSVVREALNAAIRAANLALFVIRKQGIMPNSSWESGFNSDIKKAEAALAALPVPATPIQSSDGGVEERVESWHHATPHPRWKPNDGSERHPQTVEEWDYRNDPVGGALDLSLRRLNVAGDYDDPRAPDQMALVLRTDLISLKQDWIHKNAGWDLLVKERQARLDTSSPHNNGESDLPVMSGCGGAGALSREEALNVVDYVRARRLDKDGYFATRYDAADFVLRCITSHPGQSTQPASPWRDDIESAPIIPFTNEEWFNFPLSLRQRWWKETDYSRKPPSDELMKDIRAALTPNAQGGEA